MNIIYYFKLIRLHNIMIAFLSILLSAYLIDVYDWYNILVCMLLIFFSMSFANSMNDILDLKSDKINHPHRVICQGLISKKTAQALCCLSLLGSISISFLLTGLINKLFFYIILILLVAYNFFLKKIALVGNLIIALLLSSVFIFSEFILTNQINVTIIPASLAFGLSFIRENIKDLHDYRGDQLSGMTTTPVLLGVKSSSIFISILIFILGTLFIYPYYYGLYGLKYLISLILFIEIPLLYSLFLLLNFQTIKTFKQLTNMYKILSIFGLVVIFLTKK